MSILPTGDGYLPAKPGDFKGPPVLVLGGYGVFGSLAAAELARRGIPGTVAGRDAGRARALASTLGPGCDGLAVDASDREACRRALRGRRAVLLAAGPFGRFGTAVAEACLAERCAYVDLADDRAYVFRLRSRGDEFERADLPAVYGASSLPGLSGAVALAAAEARPDRPRTARVTLFIGNANRKGQAAIESLVQSIARRIEAPQGDLRGLGDLEPVPLPPPFGRSLTANFESPEYDLFGPLLGVEEVRVKVGFELPGAIVAFWLLSVARFRPGPWLPRAASAAAPLLGHWGHSGGMIQVELTWPDGFVRRAAAGGPVDGQRLAVLPAVLSIERILGEGGPAGARTAYEYLGHRALLSSLPSFGATLWRG